MPFDIPSIETARDFVVALGHALFRELNFGSRFSQHGKFATFLSGSVGQIHYHVQSAQKDLHPLTAGDGKPINDWGNALGVERKGATPARKAASGRVRGQAGMTVASGTQLQHASTGLLFKIANTTMITIPGVLGVDPDSYYDADIAGVDVGSQTRLDAGETLAFVGGAPAGIEGNVQLQLDLDEDGFDEEQFGAYRARVLAALSETPSGGSASDFARWAKEALPAVREAFAFPQRAGRGSVDVAAFYAGTGAARSLSSIDRDAVAAYIRTKAPFQVSGDGGDLRILITTPDPQRVEILITPTGVTAFNFDWPGSGAVLDWAPTTRELQWSAPLPTSLRAGHRLILDGTVTGSGVTAQDGRQYKIESISGADSVILEEAPPTDPEATDLIYPGGPLVDRIRNAVKGHLNGETIYAGRGQIPIPASQASPANPRGPSIIGLDILAEGIGPANLRPDGGRYGKWSGGILLATLYKIATFTAGVRNVTFVTPSVDYDPEDYEFPNDDEVPFVTPSVVIIRGA
jgi:uncharacterized phage protein gp47/JayE